MRRLLVILWMLCFGILSAQTYHVGDVYTAPDGSQGIVYYLHPDGSGGWVVALTDASTACRWGDYSDVPGLANQDPSELQALLHDTAGYANTLALRNHQNNNPSYAAGVVDFEHGWVFPSPAQLSMLYAQLPFISSAITDAGGTNLSEDMYWCSAEKNEAQAWLIHFTQGNFNTSAKTSWHSVRAVRSFTYEPTYLWSTGDTTPTITVALDQTTQYSVTVTSSSGCSASVERTIGVNPVDSLTVEESACEYFAWHGDTLRRSGIYTDTLVNIYGCDSVVTLVLTILHPQHTDLYQTACGSYTWNGITYSETGVYSQHYTVEDGCDSIVTLWLTIGSAPEVSVTTNTDSVCAGENVTLQATASDVNAVPLVAIGDILCTDGTTVKPSVFEVSGKTAQGIVFYVDTTGTHGWAVHLHDQSERVKWCSINYDDVPGMDGFDNFYYPGLYPDYEGYANTLAIWTAGDSIRYPAAHTVDFLNGWYLPDVGQLDVLFSEIVILNSSLQQVGGTPFQMNANWHYWSSTEAESPGYAWYVASNGRVDYTNKAMDYENWYGDVNSYLRVRSIRDF